MRDDDVRATWSEPPVPGVGPDLPWNRAAPLWVMLKLVGPLRRRKQRPAMPPPLTAEETARRLYTLPVSYWTYDFEPGVRHVGPMSQDFAGAFGLGDTNRQINMVDANGVATIAIQVLNRRVEALQKEVARLSALVADFAPAAPVSAGGQTAASGVGTVGTSPGTVPGADRED